MAITKDTVLERLEVYANGIIIVRFTVFFVEDGARTDEYKTHRQVFTPDMPLTELPSGRIRQIANLIWTPQLIADYKASKPTVPSPV